MEVTRKLPSMPLCMIAFLFFVPVSAGDAPPAPMYPATVFPQPNAAAGNDVAHTKGPAPALS